MLFRSEALERLREITPSGLRAIVADGLRAHDARLVKALGRLEAGDREAARLMRSLVDELAEAYSRLRQGIDPGTVDLLYRASRNLGSHLDPGVVDQLDRPPGSWPGCSPPWTPSSTPLPGCAASRRTWASTGNAAR